MKLLKQALQLNEKDQTQLPEMTMKDIQSNIRKGAQDTTQNWANALELVHKAYSVSQVQRPKPGMTGGWKQYEQNIAYAVDQLAKARGLDANWRMSSAALHEAITAREFNVILDIPGNDVIEAKVNAPDTETVVDMVVKHLKKDEVLSGGHEVQTKATDNGVELSFWLHGIRDNAVVTITPV